MSYFIYQVIKYEVFKNPGHTLNGVLYQVELTSKNENDKSEDDNSILKVLIKHSNSKSEKYKRKLPLNSSFEIISIKSKSKDPLIRQLIDILPKWGGKIDVSACETNLFDSFKTFDIINTCTIDYLLCAKSFSSVLNCECLSVLRDCSDENKNIVA